jgi:transcriptional activator HAC1
MANTPIKFEQSPADSLADSFASTPGTLYPSLFDSHDTIDRSDVMTPPFDDDDEEEEEENSMFGSLAGTPAPESKPVKKRKSWGQQLPEPKTNLPPRYAAPS